MKNRGKEEKKCNEKSIIRKKLHKRNNYYHIKSYLFVSVYLKKERTKLFLNFGSRQTRLPSDSTLTMQPLPPMA